MRDPRKTRAARRWRAVRNALLVRALQSGWIGRAALWWYGRRARSEQERMLLRAIEQHRLRAERLP